MNIKEIIDLLKQNIPFWMIHILIFGSNKTHEKQIGHKPGSQIHISKYWHSELRQIEFLYRIIIINLMLFLINHWMAYKFKISYNMGVIKVMIIMYEWLISFKVIKKQFKKNLISFDKNDYLTMYHLCNPMRRIHVTGFLINIIDILHHNLFGQLY